jgi:hypothetical protein
VPATVAELTPLAVRTETSKFGDRAALYGAIAVALDEARAQMFSAGAAASGAQQAQHGNPGDYGRNAAGLHPA